MPLLQWSDDLSVGVEALDCDHKHLFAVVNDVFDAVGTGAEGPRLVTLFDQLITYTRDHFAREEALMAAGHFPGLAAHRVEHAELAGKVIELRRRFFEHTLDERNPELLVLFKTWLMSHIRVTDLQYKPYVITGTRAADWQPSLNIR